MKKTFKAWIEAMRLRTLPVSLAGVIIGAAYAVMDGCFNVVPALLCMVFALLAQISSNFANEYYDYASGLDRKGREGPRRGVTEGDITPRAMKAATFITLIAACAVGCSLILYSGWWLIAVGSFIALGVLAYSAGPYPLSHHALGEVAVVIFYGLIPVVFTYYLMAHTWPIYVILGSMAAGLLGANVLVVNNYRDRDDDLSVGKHTIATRFGLKFCSRLYLANGIMAIILMIPTYRPGSTPHLLAWSIMTYAFIDTHFRLYRKLTISSGRALNPLLGATAFNMLCFALIFLGLAIFSPGTT